jgi:tetratricopeptide (TPR) repeat protein
MPQKRKVVVPKRGLPKAPLLLVLVAIPVVVAVLTHHPDAARATRGPVQRLYAPISVNQDDMLARLKAGNFAAVEAALKSLQASALKDPREEMNLTAAYASFASADPTVAEKLHEWTMKATDSAIGHCARAMALLAAATQARGHEGGAASSLPPENFTEMEKDLNQAVGEADSARHLDPSLVVAYLPAINAARMETDDVALDQAARIALGKFPASFAVREAIMIAYEPKWGGSFPRMEKFGLESQVYASQNPMMRYLAGFCSMAQAAAREDNGQWNAALPLLNQAIEQGGDYPDFYGLRGKAYYNLKMYDEAMEDFLRADQLIPKNPGTLGMLALSAKALNRPKDALGFANQCLQYRQADEQMAQVHDWAVKQVLKQ